MRIPVIQGVIDRRILANFRVDPKVMAKVLPPPFRPQLVNGWAIAGICLIRLKAIRPRFVPFAWGLNSENAAHRIAVEWNDAGQSKSGVYIHRRDTNSRLNTWVGGRIFPGQHHYARFVVREDRENVYVSLASQDGDTRVAVSGHVVDRLPESSVFDSVATASAFFQRGALGYSATSRAGRYDGLELHCRNWLAEPLQIDKIESSYFSDESIFPTGSIQFDCALLMRGIQHEWRDQGQMCCAAML